MNWNQFVQQTVNGLTDGLHTVQIRAIDAAGNADPSPASWTWHRDSNAPTAILNDPGSQAPDRFLTFPFTPLLRRHDRSVAAGFAWGGSQDDTQERLQKFGEKIRYFRKSNGGQAGTDDVTEDNERGSG